jgi:hypothetical protein
MKIHILSQPPCKPQYCRLHESWLKKVRNIWFNLEKTWLFCANELSFRGELMLSLGPVDAHKEDRPIIETGQVEWPLKNQPNAKKSRINFF